MNIFPIRPESAPELDQNTGRSPAPEPTRSARSDRDGKRKIRNEWKEEKHRKRNEKPSGREEQLKRGKKKKEGKWRGREGWWKE